MPFPSLISKGGFASFSVSFVLLRIMVHASSCILFGGHYSSVLLNGLEGWEKNILHVHMHRKLGSLSLSLSLSLPPPSLPLPLSLLFLELQFGKHFTLGFLTLMRWHRIENCLLRDKIREHCSECLAQQNW
jgi:hypothetical protein